MSRNVLHLVEDKYGFHKEGENYIIWEEENYYDGKRIKILDADYSDLIHIHCRINNVSDLYKLRMAADVINKKTRIGTLYISYLMGQHYGNEETPLVSTTFRLIADDIKSVNARRVVLLDPIDRMAAVYLPCEMLSSFTQKINNDLRKEFSSCMARCFISDKSVKAFDPYFKKGPLDLQCKFGIKVFVENSDHYYRKGDNIVVFYQEITDDNLGLKRASETLRELGPENLILVAPHAISSHGIRQMAECFDRVYISNSFNDWEDLPNNVIIKEVI